MSNDEIIAVADATAKAVVRALDQKQLIWVRTMATEVCCELAAWDSDPDAEVDLSHIIEKAKAVAARHRSTLKADAVETPGLPGRTLVDRTSRPAGQ